MAENMVKAGRAGLTFGGDWDSTVEYNRLVGVRYNNNLFFSKKTVPAGTIPEDGEFWFLAIEGLTDAEKEALANKLDKTGGTVDGNILVETSGNTTRAIGIKNTIREIEQLLYANDGFYALRDMTAGKNIIESKADGTNTFNGHASKDLPLTGGTIEAENDTPLILKSKTAGVSLRLLNNEGIGWYFGFSSDGEPRITGKGYLLHTGNKPTGTYTGNGDATERRIKVGGIGKVVYVFNTRGLAIVTTGGTAVFPNGGEFTWISATTLDSLTMEIVLKTDNANLNGSNLAFNYQVA